MRILVTGFGPFLEHRYNPSAALARTLHGRRIRGVSFFACAPLPVLFEEAARRTFARARAVRAEAVLALGLAADADRLRLEAFARNLRRASKPDEKGRFGGDRPVAPGAPARLPATLALDPMSRALHAGGHAVVRSEDAGGYVCNDLYFRLLHAGWRALFVHVPPRVDVSRVAGSLAEGAAVSLLSARPPRLRW